MTVYISVPMTGRPVKEVEAEIKELKKNFPFAKKGTKFISNLEVLKASKKNEKFNDPLRAMSVAFYEMSSADAILVSPNWRKSKGCRIEVHAALSYGLPIYGLKYDEVDKLEVIIRKKNAKTPTKKVASKTKKTTKKTATKTKKTTKSEK